MFVGSPGLHLIVASRMTAGDFVVDEEHVSGMHFEAESLGADVLKKKGTFGQR